MAPKAKTCPPGKILNPETNRCVKIDGKIGKAILAAAEEKRAESSPKRERLLKSILSTCNNDADPISMDAFADMTDEQLESLVMIGKGAKKNCYLLENIYEVYKIAVESNKPVRDPMDPSHELTASEKKTIDKMMKARDASYKSPKYESPRPYPKGYDLEIGLSTVYDNYFYIRVMHRGQIRFDLGLVPGWVEAHHTGSTDYTSGVLIANIRELWDQRKLMTATDGGFTCCNVQMARAWRYWQGSGWRAKFIQLCEDVKSKL